MECNVYVLRSPRIDLIEMGFLDRFRKSALPERTGKLQSMQLQQEAEVLVGTPKEYPKELLPALRSLFNERGDVRRAYLAYVSIGGNSPQYLFGIEAQDDLQAIFQAAGEIAEKYFSPEQQFGFLHINNENTSDLFEVIEPFYKH
jgi:hypothetical protein